MASNTKGGLKAGWIENKRTGDKVYFHFNPYKFRVRKNNKWKPEEGKGTNVPKVNFSQGSAQTLTVELYFDTQHDGTDVRGVTSKIWKMMMIQEGSSTGPDEKGEPPPVIFCWDRLQFESVITKLSEDFELFAASGMPLRSKVKITLQQYIDPEGQSPQVNGLQVSSSAPQQTTTATQGDRIDNTANATNGSSDWRPLAAENNIDDPLNVPPGTQITS